MESKKVIEIKNINKQINKKRILNNISFDVFEGDCVALIGPNGAGKTTLMNCLLGNKFVDSGSIKINNLQPTNNKLKKSVNVLPQENVVPQKLKVKELIDFVKKLYKDHLSDEEIDNLLRFDNKLKETFASKLSGGQRRLLSFVLSLIGKPSILFLDEPTAGMDTSTRIRFWEIVNTLKNDGLTIIYSSHYIEEVEHTADRILVLNKGELIRDTTPHAMRAEEVEKFFTLPIKFLEVIENNSEIYNLEIKRDSFNVSSTANFANGDGLCFLSRDTDSQSTRLEGFRVNRAVGNRLYPFKMPRGLKPGMGLYRNQDQAFDKELSGKTAERKIAIKIWFGTSPNPSKGEECLTDSRGTIWAQAEVIGRANPNQASNKRISNEHPVRLSPPLVGAGGGLQLAQKPQRDNIIRQFTKLGNTVYECSEVEIVDGADKYFIPSSILAELRRMVVEELDKQILNMQRITIHRKSVNKVSDHKPHISMVNPSQYQQLPYLYNISNDAARKFYEQQGLTKAEPAFEIQYPTGATNGSDSSNKAFSIKGDKETVSHLLMQCRHCIRYSLGYCVKRGGQKPTWREPLFLELPDKRRFRLEFDCKNCQMNVCNVT